MRKGLLITLGIGALLVGGLVWLFNYASNVKTEGVTHEAGLTAQYSADQNEYSQYSSALVEQLAVSDEKKEAIKEIIDEYVSGRKSEGSGSLATMVKEAVPDLGSLSIYDKIVQYIQEGRARFKQKQEDMLKRIENYEIWQNAGLIRPTVISFLGFPSNRLRAQIGKDAVYGQAALDKMRTILTNATTQKNFQDGTEKPLVTPKSKDNGGK